jgi:gliding motility-associated-like protein
VIMEEVSPGCKAVIRQGRAGIKYDLVLAPGADPTAIQFTYEGADDLMLRDGVLVVGTSLGRMTERIPLAWQDINGSRVHVECAYVLEKGVVGIRPGAYDPAYELVIDPTLEFATYSGSFSDNFGYTATFDNAGYLYSGSTAFNPGYPVTTGAYQSEWAGGATDIALTKYDTTGSFLVWSTYLGGSGTELPHSLFVDNNDQLLVLGTTGSSNFPTTTNAFDQSFNGGTELPLSGLAVNFTNGSDLIISRLSSDGAALLGSTYLGGSANDGLNTAQGLKFNYADEVRGEILLDASGNAWVVTTTRSTDMPVTPDAAQPTFGGGTHDGYIARLDPMLTTLQYASYLGGSAADAIYSADLDQQGRLYVCGGTRSSDLPASSGAVSTTLSGGTDAFAARLAATGALESLTYWGSPEYDQSYFIRIDGSGGVYLFGQTAAADSMAMIFNAPYAQPHAGQFITKLDPDLSTVLMSSRVGRGDGDPDISPTAFLVDVCHKIYISGWGSSSGGLGGTLTTAGLPVSADAHQSTTDGHDLYIAVFDINMTALEYATYYGGTQSREHVDGGTSRFDRRGKIYQTVCAGCTNNDDFPTTPGAWSSTNNSSNCNSAVLKMDFNAPIVAASFLAPDTACAAGTIPFTNLSGTVQSVLWNFGDGNISPEYAPIHTYAQPGSYTVWLTVHDPLSCNLTDSISRQVVIQHSVPVIEAMNDTLICGPAGSFTLVATGTATQYIWSSSSLPLDTLNTDLLSPVAEISPALEGTYFIHAGTAPLCRALDSVTVIVRLADPHVFGDTLLCFMDTATLQLTGVSGDFSIIWSPEDEILSGQGGISATTAPLENMVYGVEVITPEGCQWEATIGVQVSPVMSSSISASADATLVISGTPVQLTSTPVEKGIDHHWIPAEPLNDPDIHDPIALVTETTTFTVTVSDGICTKDASVTVTVYELVCEEPDIFVPNTFTPNGDGSNDILFVRGRHITDLEFMVFNRWGEKVFETRDRNIGWDGTYNGMDVDPAVFVYHLTAWCLDGQRYFTKGNVTVVR